MLQRGNTKLGPLIHTFSIPAILCCPGRTKLCEGLCYADHGFYHMATVKEALEKNYHTSKQASFVNKMIQEITNEKVKILRVHVAGDFYSAAYVRKWSTIIERCQGTQFYVYTRSWRVPTIQAQLCNLAKLKNVLLWWSTDSETAVKNGKPPRIRNVRTAYLAVTDDEGVPAYADLVFRNEAVTLEKYHQGVLVCPAENGMTYKSWKMTCSRCQLCLRRRKMPKKEYALLQVPTPT